MTRALSSQINPLFTFIMLLAGKKYGIVAERFVDVIVVYEKLGIQQTC